MHRLHQPQTLLILLAVLGALSFSVWHALLNNFVVERAGFTGAEIGILQSLREVPGFLAFTAVFVLLFLREQKFALLSVGLLGAGVAATGFWPTPLGLYITTILMSVGFHYYYTLQQSLTLQWIDKQHSPIVMGRQVSASSIAALVAFGSIWLCTEVLSVDYIWMYLTAGGLAAAGALFAWFAFPQFPHIVPQHKHLLLRRRYWLYYALTFMSGARRQIFIVFAGFLMVEKFGFSAANIALLFLINHAVNAFIAPTVGRLIARFGERLVLIFEYLGLIGIFTTYAFVTDPRLAAVLYVLDHMLFAMAFGIKTYFQKIADPADIASTSGVSFTINHVAAVVIPVVLGFVWLQSPALVFLSGTAMAGISLLLALMVPPRPGPGAEVAIPVGLGAAPTGPRAVE
ncbi:MAG: hypothetical protein MAG794_00248 [Gammaproteobacteria bacterium]|nr:hypothetical protein [Gammaproteobacteria bacterium]